MLKASNSIKDTVLTTFIQPLKAFLTIRCVCTKEADGWNDLEHGFVCQKSGEMVESTVLIWTDLCSRGWPVLLYQCFPDFYERWSHVRVGRVCVWGGLASLHARCKESSFCCGSGK